MELMQDGVVAALAAIGVTALLWLAASVLLYRESPVDAVYVMKVSGDAAGLDAALDFIAETGMETIRAHETALMRRFYEGVRDIPGVTAYGDFTHERTAVVALNIADLDSGEVADALAEDYGIATRSGAHCAPRLHRALGTEGQGAVRFSFGWYNTEEETDAAIRAVEELAR